MENNIKEIRRKQGMRQQECAKATHVSLRAWQNYEQGTREPRFEMLCAIADLFGVTTDDLLGHELAPDASEAYDLSEATEEDAADHIFMSLPPEIRKLVLDTLAKFDRMNQKLTHMEQEFRTCMHNITTKIDTIAARSRTEEQTATWSVCYSEDAVSTGTGYALNKYESMGRLDVVDTPEARRADFAVKVSGDSMEPDYSDGDIVFVQQVEQIELGQIGVFFVNGSGYIKEYGGDSLISHNPKYDDIQLHGCDTLHCFGCVIGVAKLPS